jgi:hypothetical protein
MAIQGSVISGRSLSGADACGAARALVAALASSFAAYLYSFFYFFFYSYPRSFAARPGEASK